MLLAEEFERCEKCGQGWFEKREFVLVLKGSPKSSKPVLHKKEVHLKCVGCDHTQYKYTEQDE